MTGFNYIYVAATHGVHSYAVDDGGNLIYKSLDASITSCYPVSGDQRFVYAGSVTGLHSYSVSNGGILTYVDSETTIAGLDDGVWSDGVYIYGLSGAGVHSYSVSDVGILSYIGSDTTITNCRAVWGDGNYIYIVKAIGGIYSYSVSSSGVLAHVDSETTVYQGYGVWGDGSYIYVASYDATGIHSYSVSSAGILTHVDSDAGVTNGQNIWSDGTFIYVANADSTGLHSYSQSSGVLTHIDSDTTAIHLKGVSGDGEFIYTVNSSGIYSYSVSDSGALTYVDSDATVTTTPRKVWASNFPTTSIVGYYSINTDAIVGATLLLHCDGSPDSTAFPDSSNSGHVVTAVGDAKVDAINKKFGTGSLLLDGTGDYLTIPDSVDFDLENDFTVEAWYRHAAAGTAGNVILANCPSDSTTVGWAFYWLSNVLYFRVSNGSGGWAATASSAFTPVVGTWYHIAASRSAGTIKVWLDGTVGGTTASYSTKVTSGNSMVVGAFTDFTGRHNGNLDDIRLVLGRAMYTSNFTAPIGPIDNNVGDTWVGFDSGAIERGSDYGSAVVREKGQKTIYWQPGTECPNFRGDAQITLTRNDE